MTEHSLTDEHVHETHPTEEHSPSGTATRVRREEGIQGGGRVGETSGRAGSGWQDHLPIESGGKSTFRWAGDLTLLITGIGAAIANLVAAGIGLGVWLRQWQGWSPAVVTGLITAGGVTILGWGLFRG